MAARKAARRARASAESLSPQDLQSAIRDQGQDWQAASTSLSGLSAEEQRAHLGLVIDEDELEATTAAIKAATSLEAFRAVAAPASIDWRNNNGNWVTPIRDQQSCGSCVSFATVATIESRLRIVCRDAGLNVDLSEAHLFYCGCSNCCNAGWNFAPALDFTKSTGVAQESAFPYVPGNRPCPPNLTPHVKITAWTQLLAVADRKNVLATKGPVVGGMAVYQDFYSYRSGVYRHVTGGLAGYHAISVIGYDDALRCWICKNSWGTGWGDNGFFRIAYGDCGIDTQFAAYDVDLRCPDGDTSCEQYVAVLRRVLVAARTNALLRACLRHYVCGRGALPWWCPVAHRELARQIALVLRRCPRYRVGFCRALG